MVRVGISDMQYTFFYKKQTFWLQSGCFVVFRQFEPLMFLKFLGLPMLLAAQVRQL